ncbi:MAG: MMPL family transporter [Pseudolysinimonas sp.]|uniref:MMPL family transporter n=1 Tax=Pseudolysinimonas sp. TaxID=2680009 RepID=UPI003C70CA25
MARLLARLGRFSARRPWLVIVGWVLALAAAGGAYLFSGAQLATGFSIPNTPTQQVTDKLSAELDGVGGAVGTVVFQTDDGGAFTAEQQAEISSVIASTGDIDGVATAVDPFDTALQQAALEQQLASGAPGLENAATLYDFASEIRTVSDDGSTAVAAVVFDDTLTDLAPEVKNAVAAELDDAGIDGVTIEYSSEIANSLEGLVGVGEVVGLLAAALVLVVMLGALIPASLPLVSSVLGVGVGVAGSLAFSGVVEMASVTPVLGVMLGLAVGIDYTLFIINRHRRQLKAGADVRESIALANGTAGNAVVFAGATVVIALLALNVTGIPFLGVMGTVAAACVLIAVLVAVTFTPALLGLVGLRVLSKRARAKIGHPDHVALAPKAMPTWRAIVAVVAAVGILLVAAIPALSLRLGLPDGSSEPEDSTQYRAYSIVAEEFGAGTNGTLVVVAEPETAVDADDQVAVMDLQVQIEDVLMAQQDVVAVSPAGVAADGGLLAFRVVPVDGPSSVSTEELVGALRGLSPIDSADHGDIQLGVAGAASGNIDISQTIADALPIYLAIVIGLSLIILVIVFRSILVPLIATGGFLLSLFAALGAVTAIYQWGWFGEIFGVHDPGPVLNFAPIILTGVLFGLAMDYQLFIGSGMREAFVHGAPARVAVTVGVRSARAVVIAAAIIMISVFGGFVFSHLAMVRPLGFGMAIGVLFDAFVVRLLLMPALMHLLGRFAWWMPKWLDRMLPDVDVEGASLERPALRPGVHTVPAGQRAGSPSLPVKSPAQHR